MFCTLTPQPPKWAARPILQLFIIYSLYIRGFLKHPLEVGGQKTDYFNKNFNNKFHLLISQWFDIKNVHIEYVTQIISLK